MHAHCGSSLCLVHPIVIVMFHEHVEWPLWPLHALHLFISLIFLLFLLPYTFCFLDVVDNKPAHFRWGAGPPGQKELPQVMSPTTTSSRRLMSNTPRSPWLSNGSLKTSTTMTSPSVRRSLMRAEDEPITLKKKACRPVCRRQSVVIERRNLLFADLCRALKKLRGKTLKANRLGLFWTDTGSNSSLTVKRRFENTNSRLIMTEEVYKNWMKRSSRRKKNFIVLTRSSTSSWTAIEAKLGSSWSSWEKSQWNGRIEAISGFYIRHNCKKKNWSKIKILSLNSLARYRNCKMKLIVWMILEIFKVLKQYAVDNPTLPVNLCLSHLIQFLKGCWDILSSESSSAPYPQDLNPWGSHISEPIHSSQAGKNENKTPVQDQWCQSGPSAKNSVLFSGGDSSKNYGADQQRLQISDLHFDKFPTPATFACWKKKFKTEVCTCSQFHTEAMQWIKEVEMVDSVDDLRSSSSVRGIRMPEFEVLDAKIASALNRIIHNSYFKRRVSLEEQKGPQRGPFPSWKTDRLPDLRILPGSLEPMILLRTMPTCSLLVFEMTIFRNSTRNGTKFYCQWRKSHMMTSWKDCKN